MSVYVIPEQALQATARLYCHGVPADACVEKAISMAREGMLPADFASSEEALKSLSMDQIHALCWGDLSEYDTVMVTLRVGGHDIVAVSQMLDWFTEAAETYS